jgi:NAD(P)H-flavin reductase
MSDSTLPFFDIEKFSEYNRRKSDLGRFELTYKAEITNVYQLTADVRLYQIQLVDSEERMGFTFKPGQFVMLEIPGVGEAPFSISSSTVRHGSIELCIRLAGNLTNFLAKVGRGTLVGIRGPFGTNFPMESMEGQNVLLVAGGLGLAPLRAPIAYTLENRSRFQNVDIVYGARTPGDLLFTYEYEMWRKFGIDLRIIVQEADGQWQGPVGMITKELEDICSGGVCSFGQTYAIVCGPPVMFKFVCNMLTGADIPMQKMFVSLERRMHCGMGKCCRCNVGSTYTCLKGPVFDYWTVMNLKEAI